MRPESNKNYLWVALGIVFGLIGGWLIWATPAEADEEHKVTICHCEPRKGCGSIEIDRHSWDRHKEHGDYEGECKVEPTTTPTEPRFSISIDRPELSCGINYVKWTGDVKRTKDMYVKFIVNGRYPEVFYGDGNWWTGELTLAPTTYKIRAELWARGDGDRLVDSQDGHFTIEECPIEPTPSPEPTPTNAPKQPDNPTSEAGAPACNNTAPVLAPANPLVWRLGGTAIVQWQPTEGNKANIYYYQNQNPDNAHAVRDTENDGYVEISELGGLDWTFGIQQSNDCAGGDTIWVVDGSTNGWVLFTP